MGIRGIVCLCGKEEFKVTIVNDNVELECTNCHRIATLNPQINLKVYISSYEPAFTSDIPKKKEVK